MNIRLHPLSLVDNIGDLVPLYRWFGTDSLHALSGVSHPLGGTAPLGVFHGVTPSATFANLLVPMCATIGTTFPLLSVSIYETEVGIISVLTTTLYSPNVTVLFV